MRRRARGATAPPPGGRRGGAGRWWRARALLVGLDVLPALLVMRRAMALAIAASVACAAGCAVTSRARYGASGDQASPTPDRHAAPTGWGDQRTVVVEAARAAGLEASLPRGGSYERAVDAARAGQYRRASELFSASASELLAAAGRPEPELPARGRVPPERWPARARTLALKAALEAGEARRLADLAREPPRLRAGEARLVEAGALHHLFLTASALAGAPDRALFESARDAYRSLLVDDTGPHWARARAGLAALDAAAGRPRDAAAELAHLPLGLDLPELDDLLASCFAFVGQRERALRALADLRERRPDWREVRTLLRITGELDPLLDDPRFRALVGDED